MESQNKAILEHLKIGKTITAIDALEKFGCLRLSGRIYDLRMKGWPIDKETIETDTGKRIARYFLEPNKIWWPVDSVNLQA